MPAQKTNSQPLTKHSSLRHFSDDVLEKWDGGSDPEASSRKGNLDFGMASGQCGKK